MTAGHVLEIAAGTGVVTRELMRTLPHSVTITATDLSQLMLDRAQSYSGFDRWGGGPVAANPTRQSELTH